MLTERDLQELLDFKAEHPVLSVYLNTDPAQGNADVYKLKLRSLLKGVDLPSDTSRIERYFDHEFDWTGRSVAIFSCAPEEYFRAYPVQVSLRSRIRTSDRPHVKPLADLFDSYGGYGVALIDKQKIRLFYFSLGELREEGEASGESIRRMKHGGGSQAAGRLSGDAGQTSYIEGVADRNMKQNAAAAVQFFSGHNVRRILLGGTEDNIASFLNQLPKQWQSIMIGSFQIGMNANHADVLEKALIKGKEAEIKREKEIVKRVITEASKGRGGVLDLDETLRMVHEGRVMFLIVDKDFRAPGYRCQDCGFITGQKGDNCIFCGGTYKEIPDTVELAVRKVLQSGGDVEILQSDASLEEHGHIGALLRY